MATFTSLGIGSGLDLNTMVTQLVALERRPLQAMQTQANALQTQVSSFGKVSSLFSALQTASNKLTDAGVWTQSKIASSDATVATAAATSGAGAASGSYAVNVQALARNQTAVSTAALSAASELVGSGTLSIEIGTWDSAGTTLTPRSGSSALTINIGATDTLQTLRDKINAAGAGVTATLVTDAAGVRLALRGNDTGLDHAFKVAVTDGDGNPTDASGLSRFAYDPGAGASQMLIKQPAANALATVNGIPIESASNQLSGVVDGLSITLNKVSSDDVSIGVSADKDAVGTAVKAFADAYNALASYIADQTKYDAATKVAGVLQGDSAINSLQTSLRSLLGATSGASTAFARLSDIGLEAQRNGTLTVNQGKLDTALGNLGELRKAFANNDATTPSNKGFARRYAELAARVIGVDGPVTTRTDGLRKLISKNSADQDRLNDRVDQYQQRLVAQYTAMDANLSKLNNLNSYVTQQIAAMNRSGSA